MYIPSINVSSVNVKYKYCPKTMQLNAAQSPIQNINAEELQNVSEVQQGFIRMSSN